jgi:protein transport protein SEC31
MSVRYVEKFALPAWSPCSESKSLVALGSIGSGVSESNAPELEIYTIRGSGTGDMLSLMSHIRVDSPFRSISWSNIGPDRSLGVIAGGHVDGTVSLWDASRLIPGTNIPSSPTRGSTLLFSRDIHNSKPVLCMEFNFQKPSLLGTGGADGTVQVMNVERPTSPDIFRGVTTTKHSNSEVVCLSWNRKVQHILASGSNQGLTIVWDLKNKKEVVTIKDPGNRTKCSSLSWNPDLPTQLLIAYNDDSNPCVQLWDMRNCSYPFREFQEHTRGVTCASFCDLDGSLIATAGRDNRSVCWSLQSGSLELYSDLNINAPVTKLEWSHHLPGFLAASTATGLVSIHSVAQKQGPCASRTPPKWSKEQCGATFGFGGKLVTFGSKQATRVSLHIFPDEPSVVDEADRFEGFLANDLRPFCELKSEESPDEHDRLTWKLLSILHEGPDGRRNLLGALGVDSSEIHSMAEKYLGRQTTSVSASEGNKHYADTSFDNLPSLVDHGNMDPDQLDNLFDEIAKNSQQQQAVIVLPTSRRGSPRSADVDELLAVTDWTQGPEAIIKQSILIGDIASAVDCCIKCGRLADALYLASGGDPELWKRTRIEYARRQKDPFIRLVGHVISDELDKLVASSDLSSWVETLAMLVTYSSGDDYRRLVEQLASRLEKERFDVRSAVLCYLCCGSFSNTVRLWTSMSNVQGSQAQALQGLVEKMSCMFNAVRPLSEEPTFTHKMQQYAELLANSGRIIAAMRCLILVPDSMETRILKERIYNADPALMGKLLRQAPSLPFDVADVRASVSIPGYDIRSQQHHQSFPPHGSMGSAGYQNPMSGSFGVTSVSMKPPGLRMQQPSMAGTQLSNPVSGPSFATPQTRFGSVVPAPEQSLTPVPVGVNPYAPTSVQRISSNIPVRSAAVVPANPVPTVRPQMQHANPILAAVPQPLIVPQTQGGSQNPSPSHRTAHPAGIPSTPAMSRPSPPPVVTHHIPTNIARSGPHDVQSTLSAVVAPSTNQTSPRHRTVGPPTSSGVSTAPHATANPITPGMPVSWPIPTPVQQQLSPSIVPPPRSNNPLHVSGEQVPPNEVMAIQRTLSGLLERCAQDGNKRKWDDTANKLSELYRMLSQGLISKDSVTKIRDLCQCIERGDFATAGRLRVELSTTDWERNRTWLFAIQLLLPK